MEVTVVVDFNVAVVDGIVAVDGITFFLFLISA
jgi:hypothetical protein